MSVYERYEVVEDFYDDELFYIIDKEYSLDEEINADDICSVLNNQRHLLFQLRKMMDTETFQKIISECTEKEGYDYANLLL